MIGRWMHSRFNRRTVLNRDFRDIGVGVGWGAPVADRDDSEFATYTIVFGWRRPRRLDACSSPATPGVDGGLIAARAAAEAGVEWRSGYARSSFVGSLALVVAARARFSPGL